MCIYGVKKQKLKKNTPTGVSNFTERPKLGFSDVKDTAKTMSCYIQVEYSVFFH